MHTLLAFIQGTKILIRIDKISIGFPFEVALLFIVSLLLLYKLIRSYKKTYSKILTIFKRLFINDNICSDRKE